MKYVGDSESTHKPFKAVIGYTKFYNRNEILGIIMASKIIWEIITGVQNLQTEKNVFWGLGSSRMEMFVH